jgi:hypothetical protein
MSGITVSYSGVHQAYQIALAADEAGMLDRFHCSIYNAPKCFGGRLAAILGEKRLASRRVDGLDTSKVEEYPWPLLWHKLSRSRDCLKANDRFDRHVSTRLAQCQSKVFVGVETCARHSFEAARRRGMLNVLDCPGVDAVFLDEMARKAATQFGLPTANTSDSDAMKTRKRRELSLADAIIVCSEFQLKTMNRATGSEASSRIIPLWIDSGFWRPPSQAKSASERLRVLFVGKISVRKGIPYLLEALKGCSGKAELTLVGNIDSDVEPLVKRHDVRVLSVRPKVDLLSIYRAHDVFVLPSLGDAFGIAAVEAMACGLPVIVSDQCGVPVPEASWRIPVMNSEAIATRLMFYAENKDSLNVDGKAAVRFASQFTPERYRGQIKKFFSMIRS